MANKVSTNGFKLILTDDFEIMANQAASTATSVAEIKTDLNALLTKLKGAGLMVPDATE